MEKEEETRVTLPPRKESESKLAEIRAEHRRRNQQASTVIVSVCALALLVMWAIKHAWEIRHVMAGL